MKGDRMWAVKSDGSWRCVDSSIPVEPGESVFEEIPEWAFRAAEQKLESQEAERVGAVWRDEELSIIADQLMAIEESEAGVEVADLLPGSRFSWLSYRSAVRKWAGAVERKPDRPV
ncbi:hypothetical protein [Pseudomonas sp. LW8]|uniref:hypothetical protein n=1 Tax=Pseudomonas sp. LW8 TaxID=3242677 RepID=UPI0035C00E60